MMRKRSCYSLCLVLVFFDGLAQSLAPRSPPARVPPSGVWSTTAPADPLPAQRLLPQATAAEAALPQSLSALPRPLASPALQPHRFRSSAVKAVLSSLLAVSVVCGLAVPTAEAFNAEQSAVAETWRTVDRLYVDRTFGGQDWFALRQQVIKDAAKGMTEAELNAALAKMLASLGDRYTRYLPPAKYATIVQSSSGDVAGVGVSLSMDVGRDLPLIVGVESGTPAAEVGLQTGDLLVQISGEECRGLAPDDAAALLRGTENTKVGIVAERPAAAADGEGGKGEKLDLIVTRRKFKVEGVIPTEATIDGRKVGIVKIKSFSSNTARDVRAAVDRFKSKGVSRVVIDLRGNVGGLLPAGIDTAGLFLDSGKDVVFIIRKNGAVEGRTTLEAGPYAQGPPLTLLVDKGTASASEVFAAAVRENERAALVGERTFGKGVIQTVEPLKHGGGVAVTVASLFVYGDGTIFCAAYDRHFSTSRYETPLHNNINKIGIPVDNEIECPPSRDAAECSI